MRKERILIVAINPAGIGTTEILIRAFNDIYPRKWIFKVFASNPVKAVDEIINQIANIKEKMSSKDFSLKEVIVKLPNEKAESSQEEKATRELIGILRFYYKNNFRGHRMIETEEVISKSFKSELEKIIYLHFKERENHWICESAWMKNLNIFD